MIYADILCHATCLCYEVYALIYIPDQKYNVFKDKITIGLEIKSRGCEI